MNRVLVIGPLLILLSCGGDGPAPQRQQGGHVWRDPQLIDENTRAVAREDADIDRYLRRQGVDMERSPTGVRHKLLRDVPGPVARPGQRAEVAFRVELLDGRVCYASEAGTTASFIVEEDHVESGLHEGIQLMSPGDSAVLVIPSYRAHGLVGDMEKIPMRSTVVYFIALKGLKDVPR
ncbi:MAG: FKBP-type peptidyl-prolyl cis-trans isomerase [Flavobacteriales bacterium]